MLHVELIICIIIYEKLLPIVTFYSGKCLYFPLFAEIICKKTLTLSSYSNILYVQKYIFGINGLKRDKTHHMTNDTIQAKQAFAQKVYDIVEAYLEANDCTIYASDGVYVDARLEPSIMDEADAEDPDRFYPLCSLIREDEETMEADGDVIDEIASQYFFVR